MDDCEWNNSFPSGILTCFLCKANINYIQGNTTSFFHHLKVEHNSLFHQKVLLAITFLDKTAIDAIVKQFEDACLEKESDNNIENDDSGISDSIQDEQTEEMSFVDLLHYISEETPAEELRKETNKEETVFTCSYCPKTFTNKRSHYNHNYQHKNKRKSLSDIPLPKPKKVKSGSQIENQTQLNKVNNSAKNIQDMIKKSKYFQANPKEISTKCNLDLHSGNKFPRVDPDLPSGWKVRKHKNSTGQIENHFLSPDGRVMKSKPAVQEYMKLVETYTIEEIQKVTRKEQEAPKLNIKKEIYETKSVEESSLLGNLKQSEIKFKIKGEKSFKKLGNKADKNQLESKNIKKDELHINKMEIKKERAELEDTPDQKGLGAFRIKKEKGFRFGKNTKLTIKKEIVENKINKRKKICPLNIKKETLDSLTVPKDEGLPRKAKSKSNKVRQERSSKNNVKKLSPLEIKKEIVESMGKNTGEVSSKKVTRINGIKFVKMIGQHKPKSGRPKKNKSVQPKDVNAGGECPICHKVRTNLKTHIADVHSTGSFPCPVCNKMFTSKNKMGSHWSRICNPNHKTRKSI